MRKGQVTVFIIIGIVLLSLVGGSVYYLNSKKETTEQSLPKAQKISSAFEPVRSVVEDCLGKVSEDAFVKLSETGGYLEPRSIPGLQVEMMNPTEGDAVAVTPESQLVIPYWFSMSSPNSCNGGCEFKLQRPTLKKSQGGLNSIEGDVAQYIDDHIGECIGGFSILADQGFRVQEQGNLKSIVSINDGDVLVELNWPLLVVLDGSTEEMSQFYHVLDLRFKDIYTVASNLTRLSAEYHFIEKHIRNIIDTYSDLDAKMLPPVTGMDTEIGSGVTWIKYTVEQDLQRLLQIYIPYLQVSGSRSYRPIDTRRDAVDPELTNTVLNRGMLIPLEDMIPRIDARFSYVDWWPMYFDLNCRGQLCQGESMLNTFVFVMGFQRYNFAYDISIPVLVELKDTEAFAGKGYQFRFFLEANMRNNEPLTATYTQLELPEIPMTGSLLCDAAQRSPANITVVARDGFTGKGLSLPVLYSCGPEACGVGSTDDDGVLVGHVPYCIGGRLSTINAEYGQSAAPLDVLDDSPQEVNLTLYPKVTVRVAAQKVRVVKTNKEWVSSGNKISLVKGEEMIFTLTRKQEIGEPAFTTFFQAKGGPPSRQNIKELELIPGHYTVEAIGLTRNPITIYPRAICFDKGVITYDDQCQLVPDVPLEFGGSKPIVFGGAKYEFDLTPDMLSQKNSRLMLYAFGFDFELEQTNLDIGDLEQMGKMKEYSEKYPGDIIPEMREMVTS